MKTIMTRKVQIKSKMIISVNYYEEINDILYQSFQLKLSDEITFCNNSYKIIIIIQPTLVSHKEQIKQMEIKSI